MKLKKQPNKILRIIQTNTICNNKVQFFENDKIKNEIYKNFEKLNLFQKEGFTLLLNTFLKEYAKIIKQINEQNITKYKSNNFALIDHQIKQLFKDLDFNEKKEQFISEIMEYFNFENYNQLWNLPNTLMKNQSQYQKAIKEIQKSLDIIQKKITNENQFIKLKQKLNELSKGFAENNPTKIQEKNELYTFLPYQQIFLQSQISDATKTNLSQDSKVIMQNIDYDNSVFDFDQTRIDENSQQLQDLGQFLKVEKEIKINNNLEKFNQLENYFQNYNIDIKNWSMDHVQDILDQTFEKQTKNQINFQQKYYNLKSKFFNFSQFCNQKIIKISQQIVQYDKQYNILQQNIIKQQSQIKSNKSFNFRQQELKIKGLLKQMNNFENLLEDLDKQEEKLEFFNIHVEDVIQELQDHAQQEKKQMEENIFDQKKPELIKLKLIISNKNKQIDKLKQELTSLKNQQRFAFQKRYNYNFKFRKFQIIQQPSIRDYKQKQINVNMIKRKSLIRLQKLNNKINQNQHLYKLITYSQKKIKYIQKKVLFLFKELQNKQNQDDISSIEKQSIDIIELNIQQQKSLKELNPLQQKINIDKHNIKKNQPQKDIRKKNKSSFNNKEDSFKQNQKQQIIDYENQIEELDQENFYYKEQILDLQTRIDKLDLENQKLTQNLVNMISDINNIILKPKFDFITQEEQLLKPLKAIYEKLGLMNQKNIFLKSEVQNLALSQDSRKEKKSSIFGIDEPHQDQQHSQILADFKNIFEHYINKIFGQEQEKEKNIKNIKKILIQLDLPENLGVTILKEIKEISQSIKQIQELLDLFNKKGQGFFQQYDVQNFKKLQAENSVLYEKVEKLQLEFNSIKNLFQDTINKQNNNKSNSFINVDNLKQYNNNINNSLSQSQESCIDSQQEVEPLIENSLYTIRDSFIDECLKQFQIKNQKSKQKLINICQKFQIGYDKKFKRT